MITYTYIDQDKTLLPLIDKWQKQKVIALDTEFERSRTYYSILSLIQIHDGSQAWLIDLLSRNLTQSAALGAVIANPELTKVIHSAEEDIAALYHTLGVIPENIFDSQIAADLAGSGHSISYSKLTAQLAHKTLAKSETRTNWLQRPLTTAQTDYAAEDVNYLLPIYHQLISIIKNKKRCDWLLEENKGKIQKAIAHYQEDGSQYFYKIKNTGKLSDKQQQILMQLCLWREQEAKTADIPRQHLLRDSVLVSIARQQQIQPELTPAENNHYTQAKLLKYQQAIAQCLHTSQDGNQQTTYQQKQPLNKNQAIYLKKLIAYRNQKAKQLGISGSLLISKASLTELIRVRYGLSTKHYRDIVTGWRAEVILTELLEQLN